MVAHGFATVTVNTGDVVEGSHFDVVLEPTDTPKLRTIGQVTANGGFTLNRNVIPEMDVSRSQMDALGYGQTLQALQEIPSVIVTRPDAGAPTTPAVVSLRGPDPSEAMVTLDGQLLNDGNTGDVDLSQFAVPAFNSVSVTEGLGPTDLEGSNTFGGAVNFVSLRPTLEDHLNLSTSVGSYGMSQSWINATGTIGKLGYAFAGDSYHQGGQVNENDMVVPANNLPIYCGPQTKTKTPNCPFFTHLGSTISAMLGLVNLDYSFSQRSDVGFRLFTLGDNRDESSALNGIAGNSTCVFSGPGPACGFGPSGSSDATQAANPVYGDHIGQGSATFAQSIRAYDAYSRTPLGSGTLTADFYAGDNNIDFQGGGISPYDVAHLDTRYNEGLSWGRSFDAGEFSFGAYLRQEALSGLGIDQTLSQSIGSYYVRGAQQIGSSTRISAGLFDANYTTFGNSLNWRLGLSQDIGSTSVARFSVGTGFRPPLLAELLFFPPVLVDGKLQPNPAAGPMDSNCVAPNGNPNENPGARHRVRAGLLAPLFEHVEPRRLDLSLESARHHRELLSRRRRADVLQLKAGIRVRDSDQHRQRRLRRRRSAVQAALSAPEPHDDALVRPQRCLSVRARGRGSRIPRRAARWSTTSSFSAFRSSRVRRSLPGRSTTGMRRPRLRSRATTTRSTSRPTPLFDLAVGKNFDRVDITVAGTNIFNSAAGPFTRYDAGTPYPGLYSDLEQRPVPGQLSQPTRFTSSRHR